MLFQNVQLGRRVLSLPWLLGIALNILVSPTQAAGIKGDDVNFVDFFPQVVIGDSTELRVYGKKLELLSVEVSPLEGVYGERHQGNSARS